MSDVNLSDLGSVIKTAYEGEDDTNAFTDAEKSKLAATSIFTGAEQTKLAEIITPTDHGAAGDGVTDDATELQAAIDAASAGSGLIDGQGLTYRVDSTLNLKSNVAIRNAVFDFSNVGIVDTLFGGGGVLSSTTNLSANASPGDRALVVVSTAAFAVGDWAMLESTEAFGAEATGNVAELIRIREVVDGTNLRIWGSLDYDYATADSAKITKIVPVENVHFEKCEFIGNPAQAQSGFRPTWVRNIVIRDCRAEGWASRAFGFDGCWHVLVEQCFIEGGTADTLNYGVAFTDGTHYATARDCMMMDCRHAVTTGGGNYVTRHIAVINCRSIGSRDAAFDSHRDCDHYLLDGCVANPLGLPNGDGIICQAARSTIVNNTVFGGHGGRHGIFCQLLLDYAGIQPSVLISNNRIVGNGGSGIFVQNSSTSQATGAVTISGNQVRPSIGASAEVYLIGIELHADVSPINRTVIVGNELSEIEDKGILLRNDTGILITDGVINSNQIAMTADTAGVNGIHMDGDAAGDISDFAIVGNMIRNGEVGILGENTDRINTVGNVVTSTGTAITVAGGASASASNITS